jgi:hypothetical protein
VTAKGQGKAIIGTTFVSQSSQPTEKHRRWLGEDDVRQKTSGIDAPEGSPTKGGQKMQNFQWQPTETQ